MDLKYRMGIERLVKKRDKVYSEISYNNRYLELVEKEIDESNEKKLKAFELKSKKRLLPLEMAATSDAIVNKELRAEALDDFIKKQNMPRRAVAQSAKRKAAKQGQGAGDAYRSAELGKLDKKLADYEASLLKKYPDVATTPPKGADAEYQAAKQEEEAKRAGLEKHCLHVKNTEMAKIRSRVDAKNAKLQVALDASNKELKNQTSSLAEKLDDGLIMSIKNMKMYFSGIKAVDDLSFDIKEGDIFGLIGPNGAGKTTLFNCITQFYKATDGEIYYRDRFGNVIDLRNYQSHDVARTGIVRTFQNLAMVPLLPVMDNLMIGAHIYYSSSLFHQFLFTKKLKYEEKANRALALDVLGRLGLEQYVNALPMNLSYGILKKVELARTLMSKPRLIILDEPAAGLNDTETEELVEVIRKIRSDFGCTIFLVEHDMNLVMNVCDTVCAISFGKMLGIGTPEEIQKNPLVQKAYLGEDEEGKCEE
ncbi:MAG: ATP-binding cassette domain-containing protein [Defluviitaleaceae bacterium]|nr:ATP-binding cassette domain-containing protein [Defluviitaleaceae bacterium]